MVLGHIAVELRLGVKTTQLCTRCSLLIPDHSLLFTDSKIARYSLYKLLITHCKVVHYSLHVKLRSSHRKCSISKGILRNFAKFTGKYLRQGLFLNKVAGWGLFFNMCFPKIFAKFLTSFL